MNKDENQHNDDVATPPDTSRAMELLREVRNLRRQTKQTHDVYLDNGAENTVAQSQHETTRVDESNDSETDDELESIGLPGVAFPKKLSRFTIEKQIGSGGFSRVFLAHDPKLDRKVALKVPNLAAIATEEYRERFNREAKAAGILSHPAIVPVFESGNVGPLSYIAYQYCEGQNLADWFESRGQNLPLNQAASIVEKLAHAVEHAHQRGVIHRDLKPANILVESQDGQSMSFRITDFGLAKHLESNGQSVTTEGAIVGTPAYMSPEQALGGKDVSKASDIFSLGIILYELLTGVTPFCRDNHLDTLHFIRNTEPTSPSKLKHDIPADLDAICLKCLEKDPERRYESAFQLADDLNCWSDGRAVSARRPGRIELSRRWCKRNPGIALATAASFLSLALGMATTTWQWRAAQTNAKLAQSEKGKALVARNDAIAAKNEAETATQTAIREKKIAESANLDSETLAEFLLVGIVTAAQPKGVQKGKGNDITVAEMLSQLESGIEESLGSRPVAEARTRNLFGSVWQRLGNYEKAAIHLNKVLELKDDLGQLDKQLFLAALQVGNHLFKAGKLRESKELFVDNIERIIDEYGEEHQLSLAYRNSLAAVSLRSKEYQVAIREFQHLADMHERLVGPDNIATQTMKRNLGVAYRESDNAPKSVEILQQLLEHQKNQMGINNYQTLATMSDLAESHNRVGNSEAALEILDIALPQAIKTLGEKNPKTIELRFYKARNLLKLGKVDQAIRSCEETKIVCEKQFGVYHSITNQASLLLAQIALEGCDYEKVEVEVKSLLGLHQQHENIEKSIEDGLLLGRAYLLQGKLDEVLEFISRQRPMSSEILGEDHSRTEQYDFLHARTFEFQMKWKDASLRFENLVNAQRSSSHLRLSFSKMLSSYANSLNELGRYDEAKAALTECLNVRKNLDVPKRMLVEARSILASVEYSMSASDNAFKELEAAHNVLREISTDQSFEMDMLLRDSSIRLKRACGEIGQAEREAKLQRAIDRINENYGL